jgi:hypothetical protein
MHVPRTFKAVFISSIAERFKVTQSALDSFKIDAWHEQDDREDGKEYSKPRSPSSSRLLPDRWRMDLDVIVHGMLLLV